MRYIDKIYYTRRIYYDLEQNNKIEACQAGSIVVVSKLFNDIIRKLPEGAIKIEKKEDNKIFIKSARS